MTTGTPAPRVAYVLLHEPRYSETFITSEIRAVRDAGAVVEVFAARGGAGRLGEAGQVAAAALRHPVRLVRHLRALGLSDLPRAVLAAAFAVRLSRRVAAFRPDVVHTHFVNLPTAVAALVARELGRPATALAHAADFLLDTDPAGLDRRLRLLSHLFVISDAAARQLTERGADLRRIPHSVVRAAFDGAQHDRAARPAGGATTLVTVARLIAKKGVDTAVDAVARLAAAGVDVRYEVYGDGPLLDDLRRRADRGGVAGRVRFHGAVPHEVATRALAAADVAVLPCRRAPDGDLDGIPVFLMEAASRGVPVVTTAVSGIPELVGADGGWLVPPDDPAALAAAIREITADPAAQDRRTRMLRARIQDEFSPALQAQRLLRHWRALCGDTPAWH
ncbi:glycosyltransferase [Spirilliplanes yamanashiensis]|uniref:Colanic acid biosynthesis glycosyltransferase WcaL n=1 Tax=Spirilliplanes yamanashiensis TaxID=42233 RepID=A0A8J3Y5X8_9ACTN|nr:glycosyltransferase [Spirilliplanes yamanashiensis]MDP9814782.1 glycosyltransferase involved in cell wall biosynthesis [Spirilliplanes yamanashiensis]GIJ02436.1 colanic acid biosynthesis glycosyltransferase WcaL [Spirilliplanes yamanashiensis]